MKKMNRMWLFSTILLVLAGIITGCGTSSSGGGGPFPTPVPAGILYVGNTSGNSVLSFHPASSATGNMAPFTALQGPTTTLNNLYHIAVDPARNILYVANNGNDSVLIYDNASTATGDMTPSRILSGNQTHLNRPGGIFVDSARNILYVGNIEGNSITVYDNANSLSGNIAPSREITALSQSTFGVTVDTIRDILYVAFNDSNSIGVWEGASTSNGSISPNRTIQGAGTSLSSPDGLFIDSGANTLYVANQEDSIAIFNSASTAVGNVAPARLLVGAATFLSGPRDVFVAYNQLYVTNAGNSAVVIFRNASTITGNTFPAQILAGAATTLNGPTGLYIDTSRNN